MKSYIIVLSFLVGFCSFAQNAALDPAFGNAGFTITPNTFEFRRFAFDPDGNIVSMGISKGTGNLDYRLTLTKADVNGIPDTAFGTNGIVLTAIEDAEYPWGMVIQPDGKIIVSGGARVDAGSSTYSGFVIRYNNDGSVDTTFAANGIYRDTTLNNFEFMVLLSDGSIITGTNESMTEKGILFKLDSNGSPDISFGINGKLTIDAVWLTNMILLSDGKILCIGVDRLDANHTKVGYCKIDDLGSFDTSFGQNGMMTINIDTTIDSNTMQEVYERPHNAKELLDGSIVLSGYINDNFYLGDFLVKIDSTGFLDTTFGTNGITEHFYDYGAEGLEVQPDGKIIIGRTKSLSQSVGYSLTRFNSDGSLDTTFNNGNGFVDIDVTSDSDYLKQIKMQATDTLIIGGGSGSWAGDFTLARFLLDTPLSVEEPLEQFIKVYPNPFEESFFIEDSEEIIKSIKIFDNTGRMIKTISEPTQAVREIHTHFASGIYFIKIEARDGRIMNKKIMKK